MRERKINRFIIIMNSSTRAVEGNINLVLQVQIREIIKNNWKNIKDMSIVWIIKKISSVVIY